MSKWIGNEDITSSIVILGFLLGFILNPVVNLLYLLLKILKRKIIPAVPAWLVMGNVMFLLIQLFYILYINK